MRSIIKAIADKYRAFFENPVTDSGSADYPEELNYEASKLFYVVFLGLFAMLFYVQQDWIIHQHPVFSTSLRVGFCVVSAAIILLRMLGYGKNNPRTLLMIIMIYHCFMIALIAGTAGEHAASYITGFAFVMMIFIITPIIFKVKIIIYTSSIAAFFIAGIITGLDFTQVDVRYSFNDLMSAYGICILFSHTVNNMRHNSWEQRKELHVALKQNEKNIVEIQKLAVEAETANKAKSDFLANMSHEIRTPMNAILGIVEIQMRSETSKEERKEALERIYDSGNLLLNIINDVLDLSKIEAGKMELIPITYDIPSLIIDVVQINSLRYEHKSIEVILDIDADTPLDLHGDELRLKQILSNILSNAFKYTEKGTIKMSVSPEFSNEGQGGDVTLVFVISDTGQGMTPSQVGKLFDEYSRFNMEANRTTMGTGLGMAITKRFVDLMGGEIYVKSEIDVGSTFTVRVPQKRIGDSVCGTSSAEKLWDHTFRSSSLSLKSNMRREYMPYGRVLVVDDVETNVYVAKGMLMPYGLQIDTASNGLEVIDKVKNGNVYDIIFMDHMMPKMDGIEATRIIRSMGYKGIVIALTANALVGQAERFMKEGFDGFIPKPTDSRDIDAALIKHIRNKQPPEVIEAAYREQSPSEEPQDAQALETKASALTDLEESFILDAENTIDTLESMEIGQNMSSSDIDTYEIMVHGMKSALAIIRENSLSEVALKLEHAARGMNMALISEKTPAFVDNLKSIVQKLKSRA